ncbi:MAG: PrsW family glutamic-type intramembrane protease, partial [Anaerolineales bacterium]
SSSIWPFLPQKVSSGAAFLGGALGGTGFAFAEAMFLTQPVSGWLIMAIARAGASSMHALAAGLTAWGLAEGVVQKRWRRLALGFFVAVALHGLWNAAAIGLGIGQLALEQSSEAKPAVEVAVAISIGIIILLSLVAIALLPTLQSRFTAETGRQVPEHP